jgi:lipopolysaccharide export LptBFGC system permease protein LptF
MKIKLFFAFIIFFTHNILIAQSISTSELYVYANNQNTAFIIQNIQNKGFIYLRTLKDYNMTVYMYKKEGSLGNEIFTYANNSELFMVQYTPVISFYNTYSEKIKTKQYSYAYSLGHNKYYESYVDRIGLNDVNYIISLFTKLK